MRYLLLFALFAAAVHALAVVERDQTELFAAKAKPGTTAVTPRYAQPDLPRWLTETFHAVEKRATCLYGRTDCGNGKNCEFCGTCCASGGCARNWGNCCSDRAEVCAFGFGCCLGDGCCYIEFSFCCSTSSSGCCSIGQTCGSTGCIGTA
jgi:hypothetical protein